MPLLCYMADADLLVKTIGDKIKRYRTECNMSQQELADNADIAKSTIQRLEKGKYNPSVNLLAKIAMELEVTVQDLL